MAAPAATNEPAPADIVELPIRADTLAQLQEFAGAHNQSVMAYLADAVAIHRWLDEQLKDGGRVIAKPRHGKPRAYKAR